MTEPQNSKATKTCAFRTAVHITTGELTAELINVERRRVLDTVRLGNVESAAQADIADEVTLHRERRPCDIRDAEAPRPAWEDRQHKHNPATESGARLPTRANAPGRPVTRQDSCEGRLQEEDAIAFSNDTRRVAQQFDLRLVGRL